MEGRVAEKLSNAVIPLTGDRQENDRLFELIRDARLVLIGEATHGTHEFYHARAEITKRLVAEKGFAAVCIEGDWPDAYRVNRFVRGSDEESRGIRSIGGL